MMMRHGIRTLITCLCILSCSGLSLFAGETDDIFRQASTLYETGQYQKAILLYESIIEQGHVSGNLYYNIGNCYFKQNELGKAILNYERARRLMPRDADLRANYDYAVSLVKEPHLEAADFWMVRLARRVFSAFTIDEMTFIASVFFAVLLFLAALFISQKIPKRLFVVVMVIGGLILVLIITQIAGRVERLESEAVIVAEEVDARFGPFERATVHFSLYEGMKLVIIEKKGFWYKVERSDGNTGWIPKETAEIV
jgi:tetratricopeptide (TPR) repeat protein